MKLPSWISPKFPVLLTFLCLSQTLPGEDFFFGGAVISEFVAKNDAGLIDEDGDSADWIEILNASDAPLNLAGWHLTDDEGNLTLWTFPDLTLAPQEYFVLFASGKNRATSGSELHTNFSLSGSGEYLALVAPDGSTKASEFSPEFPAQFDDVSYGFQGQNQIFGFFQTPTPGAENTGDIGLFLDAPIFSQTSQILTSRPTLDITLPANAPSGAVIRFTTDGSNPTGQSPVWSSGRRLASTTQIKAAVFDPSGLYETSEVVGHRFVRLSRDVSEFSSNIPIVIIDSFGANIDQLGRTSFFSEAFSTFIDVDELTGRATPLSSPDFVGNSGIRARGSSSFSLFPKKQYRFETWDTAGDDDDVSLFGLPAESDWVLNAPWSDKSMMRNHIAYGEGALMGDYSVRTHHFELFFNQDGGSVQMDDYQGIYLLVERIKISDERLDLSRLDASDTAEPDISGGFILRKDRISSGDSWFSSSTEGVPLLFQEPSQPNAAQFNFMRDYINDFEAALHGPNSADPELGFRAYIDEDSFIDQHLLTEGMRNADGYRLSTHYHKDRNGLLKAGPGWDFNLGLGNASFNRAQFTDGWHYEDVDPNRFLPPYYWFDEMFKDEAFELAYWDRFFQLRKAQWDIPTLLGKIDDLAEVLSEEATDREFTRWPTLGVNSYANAPGFQNRLTYQSEVDHLKNFLSGRLLWMSTQFDPPPVFSEPEGAVAAGTELVMSSPSRLAIFFTTDGSDPTEGGASVQRYTRPFTLSEATWVKARTRRSNGDWGALETARYVVDETPVLVVSEIHYRPSAASSAEAALGFSRNDFEFLELTNPGSADIDLTGAEFTEGLTFTFGPTVIAPGGSVILVADLAAFESRYGTAPLPIAGEYEGGLDNDGETLTIEDRDRRVLLSFTYNDAAPWPTEADGSGPSLTLALPSLSPDDPESWRASLATGGSPGQLDSIIFTGDPSADEDGNGVNDLVEYAVVGSITYTEHSSPDLINLSYTRRMGTDSAEVIIQVSDDLISDSWTSVTAAPTSRDSHGDATETLTFSLPRGDRGFARLLVRLR